jgi:YVTN family beta-propeller protein
MRLKLTRSALVLAALSVASFFATRSALAQPDGDEPTAQAIPNTGQFITPTAPTGARFEPLNPGLTNYPDYTAGQAVTTVESPDHSTLLILTSGYNQLSYTSGTNIGQTDPSGSNEYVFVFDITNKIPVKKQVLQVPNTYNGIVFDPSGKTFYVSGGVDDGVHIFDLANGVWAERAGSPISLGHQKTGVGLQVQPAAAGIAISSNGLTIVVDDYYNDSISILTNKNGAWSKTDELDLRPGKIDPVNATGVPGGEYPFWVVIKGNNTAYISSIRDREIDVVNLSSPATLTTRIKVVGQPNKMVLNSAQTELFVAEDETDTVDVIDTGTNQVTQTIPVGGPAGLLPASNAKYTGNNTNSVTLSPDEKTLYVTNGNTNDVAVVGLQTANGVPSVLGLIPTGWYPTSVSLNGDGTYMYVVNYKSVTGPNPEYCHGLTTDQSNACNASNQYDLQLIKAGFQSFPTPNASELAQLTRIVAQNNHFTRTLSTSDQDKLVFLRSKIKHVIFIIKENRTYDQILGDLPVGNGDPDIVQFGSAITPNLHNLASQFVDLDNFYDRSEVSMDGWPWTTSARAPDVVERQVTVNYAGRGLTNDSEGTNRNVNVSYPSLAGRLAANPLTPNDPNVLPGTTDTPAPDGPNNELNTGYLWNDALRGGLSLRNYGFFIDLARYNLPTQYQSVQIPELEMPYNTKTQVAYSTSQTLRPLTDPYFRGFDNSFPDYWRYQEWLREFNANYANGGLPNLELVRFMHDHTGNFSTAIDGVNTVELDEADNDYAVGLLVETVSKSIYKDNTLIFVIEDDSQDGGDHVDSHRSIAFIVGPYVKQGQVVSTAYNTVDFVRTIEEVLGLKPLNLNDSLAVPMTDVFDETLANWTYTATPSALLANTTLPIPPNLFAHLKPMKPKHDAQYWAEATKGMDFSAEDRIDFAKYNHILWKGLMGDKPYPEQPTGLDLRNDRAKLLAEHQADAHQDTSGGSF